MRRRLRVLSVGRVLRYLAAGGGSLVLDLALQWLLRSLLVLPVLLAGALSYELALLAHFLVSNRWVFDQRRVSGRRLLAFHATAFTASLITVGVYGLLTGPLAGPIFLNPAGPFGSFGPEVAKIAGTGLALCWTFTTSFFWIWRHSSPAR